MSRSTRKIEGRSLVCFRKERQGEELRPQRSLRDKPRDTCLSAPQGVRTQSLDLPITHPLLSIHGSLLCWSLSYPAINPCPCVNPVVHFLDCLKRDYILNRKSIINASLCTLVESSAHFSMSI